MLTFKSAFIFSLLTPIPSLNLSRVISLCSVPYRADLVSSLHTLSTPLD